MDLTAALASFGRLHAEFGGILDTVLLMFARILAFIYFAPIFNRKDIAFPIKLSMALFLTAALLWLVPVESHGSFSKGQSGMFILQLLMNAVIGAMLGFIADMILQATHAAGDIINNQVGLSSAVIFDPSARKQVVLLETLFAFITTIVFIHVEGLHWLILALKRSFAMFPLYTVNHPLNQIINIDYLVAVSSNILTVATQLAAPVMVVTMAVDIILGVVNRTAQQIPVFQLSFALKPCIGVAIMLVTLPIFLNALMHFLMDYSRFF
jgi:flagellar biosynthesis protein FliR